MPARKRRLGMSTPTEIADVKQEWFEGWHATVST